MSLLRRHADVLLAAVLLAASIAELLTADRDQRGFQLAMAVLITVPVAWRRRAPLPAVAVAALGLTVLGLEELEPNAVAEVAAFLILNYSAGAHLRLRPALAGLGLIFAGVLAQTLFTKGSVDDFFFISLFMVPPWLAGRALRDRHGRVEALERLTAELELEREARARLAVEAERSRIAREMHDVLSHSVSTMTLQAGAGERLAASDPERAAETFRAIHRSGGQALDELRRMLGLLRVDRELGPQPGVDDLDELMDGARAAGLEASLHAEALPPELPPGLELTIYRIVQEAVTNALKHAGATTLHVALAGSEGAVLVTVEDDGSGEGELSEAGGAYGLVGMRERVAVYGGQLDAGPRPAGGFAVRARLPVGDSAGSR